jgi:ABC-type oligopeptide transport system substrate-binding subunit
MKKSVLFIFSFALVFALGFAGCSSGDSIASTGPSLNYVFLVSQEDAKNFNWQNAKTSFSVNSSFGFIIYGQNPDFDVNKLGIILARSGTILYQYELGVNISAQKRPDGYQGDFYSIAGASGWSSSGSPLKQAGSYTLQVYVIDVMGNKSNTITSPFTVR